jgi:Holliday junction resolvase RusA-like endonuclease
MIVLDIPIDPVAKGRPRISTLHGKPIAFTPKATRNAERVISVYAKKHMENLGKPLLSGALNVELIFSLRRPKSVSRCYPTTKPDADNYAKLAIDALNGIFWEDDSQIVHLNVSKRYCDNSEEPSIFIQVRELMTAEDNGHKKTTLRGKGVKK